MKEEIIIYIEEKLGYKTLNIEDGFDKTGSNGIDAENFFMDFSSRFEIDMTDFDFDRYFINENPFTNVIRNTIKYWGMKKSFTFKHLIKVAERKKWFDP